VPHRIFLKAGTFFCLLPHSFSRGCESASIAMMDAASGPPTTDHNSGSSLSKHFTVPHYI
jgi:hypothetical protein